MKQLSKSELKLVAGGYGSGSGSTIVVTGSTGGSSSSSSSWSSSTSNPTSSSSGWGTSSGWSSGSSGPADKDNSDREYESFDDAKQALIDEIKAKIAADGLSGKNQIEYGAVIYKNADGSYAVSALHAGESYNDNNPPRTAIVIDDGRTAAEVVAVIHSHPPSGDYNTDRDNRTVSDGDEAALQAIVDAGADPDNLTFVIIDKNGRVDEVDYKDI